jgi:prophage antirepressor-like protein
MNELAIFTFEDGRGVRVLDRDGNPWWVANDVCDILGLENTTEALRNLDDDERGSLRVTEGTSPFGGNPNVNIINESGLYNLIFRSNKPEAKRFRKWVTSEVLPAIRKQGFYVLQEQAAKIEELNKEVKRLELQTGKVSPKIAASREAEAYIAKNFCSGKKNEYIAVSWEYKSYCKECELAVPEWDFVALLLGYFPDAKARKTGGSGQSIFGVKRFW